MKPEEFRTSIFRAQHAAYLGSPAGQEFLAILRSQARPTKRTREVNGDREDVQFQFALAHNWLMAQEELIELTESLARERPQAKPTFEPLEDESDEALAKQKDERPESVRMREAERIAAAAAAKTALPTVPAKRPMQRKERIAQPA